MGSSTITFKSGQSVRITGGSTAVGERVRVIDTSEGTVLVSHDGARFSVAPCHLEPAPYVAQHLGDGLTREQLGQEYAARCTANADMLMPTRPPRIVVRDGVRHTIRRHNAYSAWKPTHPETRLHVEAAEPAAVSA